MRVEESDHVSAAGLRARCIAQGHRPPDHDQYHEHDSGQGSPTAQAIKHRIRHSLPFATPEQPKAAASMEARNRAPQYANRRTLFPMARAAIDEPVLQALPELHATTP